MQPKMNMLTVDGEYCHSFTYMPKKANHPIALHPRAPILHPRHGQNDPNTSIDPTTAHQTVHIQPTSYCWTIETSRIESCAQYGSGAHAKARNPSIIDAR